MDEAHHASADTYQKVLYYFTPEFTLGLTATPERADDKNILDIFKNTAHKLDIFNWQEEAAGMLSQMEFVRWVDVQTETIERYVRDGLLVPDLVVPISEHRTFMYFKEETLQKYAEQYGWTLIDDSNRKDLFLDMVRQMDMSYSCKPVLLRRCNCTPTTRAG